MAHRSEYQIIYDLLNALPRDATLTTIQTLLTKAHVRDLRRELKYLDILKDYGLAVMTGVASVDFVGITEKGKDYIMTWDKIQHLLTET